MKPQRFDNRVNSGKRGYSHDWHKVRQYKIRLNPCCEICEQHDIDTIATVVHHIKEITTHPELRLTMSNLVSLCWNHHEEVHGRLKISGCDVDGLPLSPGHGWHREG